MYLDTDGSLLNSQTLTPDLLPAGVASGAGATWHSAVNSELFNPDECVYVRNRTTSNNGAWCSASLTFRRVMVSQGVVAPEVPGGACLLAGGMDDEGRK